MFADGVLGLAALRAAAIAAIAATAVDPAADALRQVMSETLFLALLVPALLFAERVVDDGERDATRDDAIGSRLAAGVLTLVRTHGIASPSASTSAPGAAACGRAHLRRDDGRRRWLPGSSGCMAHPRRSCRTSSVAITAVRELAR